MTTAGTGARQQGTALSAKFGCLCRFSLAAWAPHTWPPRPMNDASYHACAAPPTGRLPFSFPIASPELHLMYPAVAGGHLLGPDWAAGWDEAERD